jgi:hypothetical protein
MTNATPTTTPPRLVISCDTCVMQHSNACDDCLVTALCGRSEDEAVVFDIEEQRALRLLSNVGLVPTIRHRAIS